MRHCLRTALLLATVLLAPNLLLAQTKTVTGTITSGSDNQILPGATVYVKGTTTGTITDFEGNYSLVVPENATLVFSFIGYITQQINAEGKTVINVILNEETSNLDEVVVTGYATQARSQMTTSISKLDTKILESAPRSNPATALQGTIAGLKVTQTTGQPGSTPTLVLRGGTDFNGSGTPLILVDGVPSSFNALNSDDIESMEVLKDAASSAIYGARAANGVVLVTTKKGKTGKSNVTFRSKFTTNHRREDPMDYLGAEDYVKFNRMGVKSAQEVMASIGTNNWLNQFLTGANAAGIGNNTTNSMYTTMQLTDANKYLLNFEGWKTMDDPVNPGTTLLYMDNKMNELIYQNSQAQDYSISMDGGNDKATYYLGLGYLDDKGLVFGSAFKRYSGTLNTSYKFSDAMKVTSNIIYSHANQNQPFDTDYNLFQRTAGLAPTSRIYNNNPDGSLSGELQPGTYLGFGNPLYYKDKFHRFNLEQRLSTSLQLDYLIMKDLNLTLRGSHFTTNESKEAFDKAYLNSGKLNAERKSAASHERILRNQLTAILNYKKTLLDKHNISALMGTEYFKQKEFKLSAATRLSPTDLIYTMNAGSIASEATSNNTSYAIASVFGQLNYDYDYKYLLGFTFRRDGASRLANDKYDFFPGVSAGWNVHKENFFAQSKLVNYINNLKPRLSYGVNGNIELFSNFGAYGTYSKAPVYDTQTGYAYTRMPLLDLIWEKSATTNFGLDMGLFNNRMTILADYFVRDVKNKFADLTLPLWTGFESIKINNGIMQNRGLELQVSADIIKNKDLTWNLGVTYSSVKNYAKKLPENGVYKKRQKGEEIYDPATGTSKYVGGLQEGERIGLDLITAYVFDGVYKTQQEIDADAGRVVEFATNKNRRFLGDTRWKDLNGDGKINNLDRVVIGRTTPDFTGGVVSDLSYKNFNLFVKTDFAVGHYIINGRRVKGIAQTQGNQNGPLEIRDSWTPANPNSDIPIFTLVDRQRNHMAAGGDQGTINNSSSRMWEKGDYLALREVTLSYTLDGKIAKNVFQSLRLYITGANLAYFNGFSGSSPEEAIEDKEKQFERGIDSGRFPLPRTVTVGLNVTF